MQHPFRPASVRCGGQLEHRPIEISAAFVRRTVEIAGTIEDKARAGIHPVRAFAKIVQNFLAPAAACRGRQLKHGAAVKNSAKADVRAAAESCPVEISRAVKDQIRLRIDPIPAGGSKLYSSDSCWAMARGVTANKLAARSTNTEGNPDTDFARRMSMRETPPSGKARGGKTAVSSQDRLEPERSEHPTCGRGCQDEQFCNMIRLSPAPDLRYSRGTVIRGRTRPCVLWDVPTSAV